MSTGTQGLNRRLPPVTEVAVASMALIIVGGIYMASHLPKTAPFGPAVGLLIASGALIVVNLVFLARLRPFAWPVFFRVLGWSLLAYLVIAGMLEYVFVFDHTRGTMLVVMTLMLAAYAVDVPVLLAFSVARYQPA